MLLTIQGYFEAGHFIADTPVQIPEGRKTIVTVLDEKVDKENEQAKYIAYWNKIIEDIQNSDEVLEDEPERIHFKPLDEIDAL
jgi:predicted KAP-like P-loop ATPase